MADKTCGTAGEAAAVNSRISPVKKPRVADHVVEQLVRLIISGEFKAGDRLPPERELAPRLSVTRMTLREALRRMEGMGLVQSRQGDGVYVQDCSISSNLDFLKFLLESGLGLDEELLISCEEMRCFIATKMIRLAAERASEQSLRRLEELAAGCPPPGSPELLSGEWDYLFYREIAIASKNRLFVYMLNSMKQVFGMLRWLYSRLDEKQAESLKELNIRIVQALRERDAEMAAGLVEQRMKKDEEELKSLISGSDTERFVSDWGV